MITFSWRSTVKRGGSRRQRRRSMHNRSWFCEGGSTSSSTIRVKWPSSYDEETDASINATSARWLSRRTASHGTRCRNGARRHTVRPWFVTATWAIRREQGRLKLRDVRGNRLAELVKLDPFVKIIPQGPPAPRSTVMIRARLVFKARSRHLPDLPLALTLTPARSFAGRRGIARGVARGVREP